MFDPKDPKMQGIISQLEKEREEPVQFDFKATRNLIEAGNKAVGASVIAEVDEEHHTDILGTSTRGAEIALALVSTIEEQHRIAPIKPGEFAVAIQVASLYLCSPVDAPGLSNVMAKCAEAMHLSMKMSFTMKMVLKVMESKIKKPKS